MSKLKKHVTREMKQWEQSQANELTKIRAAQRHLIYNVVAYCAISVLEYWLAAISQSQTLHDDDIAGVKLPDSKYQKVLGGDQRIQFVRWRYETVFSLVTAVVMSSIALSVIGDGIKGLLNPAKRVVPEPVAIIGAGIASVIMLIVWYMNRRTGHRLSNAALLASAQDSLSDAFTSIGTMVAIAGALLFHLTWLDGVTSIVVGFFILYSGLKIFFETSLNLADYFDPKAEKQYHDAILKVKKVKGIVELKAHYNGNVVSLDATLIVNGKMTVLESYQLSEKIERMLRKQFGIIDVDISFMPDPHSFSDHDVSGHF